MLAIPPDIIERLVMWCQENDIAMAQVGSDDTGAWVIIFGRRTLDPNEASIIAAHMLLTGVLSGEFLEDNIRNSELLEKPIPKHKIS